MSFRIGRSARWLLLTWAGWTLFAFFSASQNFLSRAYSGHFEWLPVVRYTLLDCYAWAALTPLVWLLAGRLSMRRRQVWWTLLLLLIASGVFALAHVLVFVRLLPWIGYRSGPAVVRSVFNSKLHSDLLTCWALFGIRQAIEYYRRYQAREWKASQLEAKLAAAQLEVLKMQLQPHFLFNTLHAISTLMYRDVESADRMIARLSDFLRLTLDSAGVQEVPLKREMEYLDKYLEIEEVRFTGRLQVHRAIDPETLDLLVPNLALQPLAENAVRYGIAPRAAGGSIEVTACLEGDQLVVDVSDDGPGAPAAIQEGLGVTNTRARLDQLYGSRGKLELGSRTEGGFRARLIVPAHSESPHARADR